MYDVTAVSHDRRYIPLAAAVAQRQDAREIARLASARTEGGAAAWSAVLVKIAATGQITDTFVAGRRQPPA